VIGKEGLRQIIIFKITMVIMAIVPDKQEDLRQRKKNKEALTLPSKFNIKLATVWRNQDLNTFI